MNWERFFNGLISKDAGVHAIVGLLIVLMLGWPLSLAGVRGADLWMAMIVIVALATREWVQAQYKAGGSRQWAGALEHVNWGEAVAVIPGGAAAIVLGRAFIY